MQEQPVERMTADAAGYSRPTRRAVVIGTGALAFGIPLAGTGQTGTKSIGLLSVGTDPDKPNPVWLAFLRALAELGYVEGRNITIRRAFAGGNHQRLPELLAQLQAQPCDVVVATGETENIEAKRALPTTPIVMLFVPDPVAAGLVESLAHPGGNVTGLTTQAPDTDTKRLQLLKDAVPHLTRFGLLLNPEAASAETTLGTTEAAAGRLGVRMLPLRFRKPEELDSAFAAATHDNLDGVVVVTDGLAFNQRGRIAELGIAARLPVMGELRNFADVGALMAYGAGFADLARRAAGYADRILRGAKPGDLPVQQPEKFELVINLKTASALGVTIPQLLLAQAHEVIE